MKKIRLLLLAVTFCQAVPAQAGIISSLWNQCIKIIKNNKMALFAAGAGLAGLGYVAYRYFNAQPNKSSGEEAFDSLVQKSKKFEKNISRFPTTDNRIEKIAENDIWKKEDIARHAQGTYPIMHSKLITLMKDFLEYKKKCGSTIEKSLYQSMNLDEFIDRLLTKRPLMFMGSGDQYLLRNGKKGSGGFELIGTDKQQKPLLLQDYLSYDEMQIAALLGVSVPTYFINAGARSNQGKKAAEGTYQQEGVYVGLVGARFEKPGFMEWKHMIVTQEQNTQANGYGKNSTHPLMKLWAAFYDVPYFSTFEEAKKSDELDQWNHERPRYIDIGEGRYLDARIYKKRLQYVIEPFLLDAQARGEACRQDVYVHTVGLGLGVWRINEIQNTLMQELYIEILSSQPNRFPNISKVDLGSWSPSSSIRAGGHWMKSNSKWLTCNFSKRNPADSLEGDDAGKLLVACYAWDGNAYPGNEYWDGLLSASGDPAAACCSTIPELQNPLINDHVAGKYAKAY